MRALAFAAALLLARPAAATVFGPELEVDAPVLTGAVGDQIAPAAAWDGRTFLVAWRTTLWKNELRAARVSASGEVLDPRGVVIDGFERSEGTVAVAAAGPDAFLLVWTKEPSRVMAALVSTANGRLAAAPALLVGEGASEVATAGPAVVWNGSSYWVLWSHDGQSAGVYAARVSPEGRLLDATPARLAPGFGGPAAASDGVRTMAAWSAAAPAGVELRAAVLENDGRAQASSALFAVGGTLPGPTSIAWGGGSYLVAGSGREAAGGAFLRASRLSAAGQVLDAGGTELTTPVGKAAGGPSVAWNGAGFSVLWADERSEGGKRTPRLHGVLVSGDGTLGALPATWSASGQMPVVVATGGEPLTLWSEVTYWSELGVPEDLDVRGVRLAAGGAAGAPALVSQGINGQQHPAIAWSGERMLVVWEDRRADKAGADVFAALLDADGARVAAGSLALGTGPAPQQGPAVAWDGQSFVVVWHEGSNGLGFARVSAAGELLDRLVVPGTAGQHLLSEPGLCADGDGVLVAWGSKRAPGPAGERSAELRGLRVPAGASVKDRTSFMLAATADTKAPPVVKLGCNERAGLLVWTGWVEVPPGGQVNERASLYLARIPRGASAFDAPGPVLLQEREGDEWAGIGSDGRAFLVAWRTIDYAGRRIVVGMRVDADGKLLDQPPFSVGASNSGQRATVVWDGTDYLVFAIHTAGGNPFQLRGRRVSRDGLGLDRDWQPVAYLAKPWAGTGSLSDGVMLAPGRTFLVYDQFFDEDASGHMRIRGRFVTTEGVDGGADPGGLDAGADAAALDAGAPAVDGGAPAAATGGGCGCRLGGRGAAPVWAALALAAWLARRRSLRAAARSRPPAS